MKSKKFKVVLEFEFNELTDEGDLKGAVLHVMTHSPMPAGQVVIADMACAEAYLKLVKH